MRRQVTQIAEVLPIGAEGHYKLRDIFHLVPGVDDQGQKIMQLKPTGERSQMAGHLKTATEPMVTELTQDIFQTA